MSDYDWDEDEPYVVIEQKPAGVGSFILGLAVGAGLALLFAPRSGAETRSDLGSLVRRSPVNDDDLTRRARLT